MGSIMGILSTMREQPAARRKSRSPTPGLPVGKVEYKRCMAGPSKLRYLVTHNLRTTRRWLSNDSSLEGLFTSA